MIWCSWPGAGELASRASTFGICMSVGSWWINFTSSKDANKVGQQCWKVNCFSGDLVVFGSLINERTLLKWLVSWCHLSLWTLWRYCVLMQGAVDIWVQNHHCAGTLTTGSVACPHSIGMLTHRHLPGCCVTKDNLWVLMQHYIFHTTYVIPWWVGNLIPEDMLV